MTSDLSALPGVSYVMPVLNEAQHLEASVRSVLRQDYPGPHELILACGPSTDGTDAIAVRLAAEDPRIRIVQNPDRDIPIALNLAVAASVHPIIVRVDAHAELSPGYTLEAVRALERLDASNVGGVMRAVGDSPVQRAVANAYNSPVGLGGGTYHLEGETGPAESAYLGVFTRRAFDDVGGFNPRVRRGEDWEFNLRLRLAGHGVWFVPSLRVTYRPRATLRELSQQFFATGSWRATLVRMYGRLNPWRFYIPGLYVLTLLASFLLLGLWCVDIIPRQTLWPLWVCLPLLAHLAVVIVGGIKAARGRDIALTWIALVVMHLSWGTGFLHGLIFGSDRIVDRSRLDR